MRDKWEKEHDDAKLMVNRERKHNSTNEGEKLLHNRDDDYNDGNNNDNDEGDDDNDDKHDE